MIDLLLHYNIPWPAYAIILVALWISTTKLSKSRDEIHVIRALNHQVMVDSENLLTELNRLSTEGRSLISALGSSIRGITDDDGTRHDTTFIIDLREAATTEQLGRLIEVSCSDRVAIVYRNVRMGPGRDYCIYNSFDPIGLFNGAPETLPLTLGFIIDLRNKMDEAHVDHDESARLALINDNAAPVAYLPIDGMVLDQWADDGLFDGKVARVRTDQITFGEPVTAMGLGEEAIPPVPIVYGQIGRVPVGQREIMSDAELAAAAERFRMQPIPSVMLGRMSDEGMEAVRRAMQVPSRVSFSEDNGERYISALQLPRDTQLNSPPVDDTLHAPASKPGRKLRLKRRKS